MYQQEKMKFNDFHIKDKVILCYSISLWIVVILLNEYKYRRIKYMSPNYECYT